MVTPTGHTQKDQPIRTLPANPCCTFCAPRLHLRALLCSPALLKYREGRFTVKASGFKAGLSRWEAWRGAVAATRRMVDLLGGVSEVI